jgi:hypothetical protein
MARARYLTERYSGASCAFTDIDPGSFCMDPMPQRRPSPAALPPTCGLGCER